MSLTNSSFHSIKDFQLDIINIKYLIYQEIPIRCHVTVLYFLWRDILLVFLDKLIHDARNTEHKIKYLSSP
jgi:hypothetical protein